MGHLMDVTGLVNIEIILGDNLRECLNAYRIEFCCHNLHRFDFGTKLSKISENNKKIGVKIQDWDKERINFPFEKEIIADFFPFRRKLSTFAADCKNRL